ncbi:MAG: HAMP domain-containing protein [Rhodomicrobium sp.]|nr:HAMP domain-containing protein [Rhodomicrobium sp.]
MRFLSELGIYYRFTTITGRIVAMNIVSLAILVGGMLYLSDFRDRLIDARSKSLRIEAEIIAKALTIEGAPIAASGNDAQQSLDDAIFGQAVERAYTISIEKAAELLRSLIEPTKTHGYIYNANGDWLVDSNRIYTGGRITKFQTPTKRADEVGLGYKLWLRFERMLRAESLPKIDNISVRNGKSFAEVRAALEEGSATVIVRENELGETILNYAVPIEKGGKVLGALLLTTSDGDIDALLANERISVLQIWLLVLIVTVGASIILAGTIADPMHRLAQAAIRVRRNIKARTDIPNYSHRSDEIGHLSHALHEMTTALYARLDAIESFAADVAHELKNPLTSLRSAVDTVPLVKKEEDRDRLMMVIRHDVKRLDRLITDISDASRLDAELARESRRPVNMAELLSAMSTAQNDIHRDHNLKFEFHIKDIAKAIAMGRKSPFIVSGHQSRLSQVICNLLDNAISFSPKGGTIRITCGIVRRTKDIEITVEDEGPGIPPENFEKIFERFYTDRPSQDDFGNNSGLGLNISRQIVTAHNGRIWAENRLAPPITTKQGEHKPARVLGARFIIHLPANSA